MPTGISWMIAGFVFGAYVHNYPIRHLTNRLAIKALLGMIWLANKALAGIEWLLPQVRRGVIWLWRNTAIITYPLIIKRLRLKRYPETLRLKSPEILMLAEGGKK